MAQHAQASRATSPAHSTGTWLRLVVRDDGIGGAQLSTVGSSSSGLAGLTDRVHAVDGRLEHGQPARRAHRGHRRPAACGLMVRRPPSRHRRGLGHPARRLGPAAGRPRIRHHRRRRRPGGAASSVARDQPGRGGGRHPDATHLHRRGPAGGDRACGDATTGSGILLFSQYIETRYAADLLADDAAGIGYLLKDGWPTSVTSSRPWCGWPRAARHSTPRWSPSCSGASRRPTRSRS